MSKRYATVLVEGTSMLPTYKAGDWLMAKWHRFQRSLRVGSVVVIEREEQPGIFYIKRISEISPDGHRYFLLADNPDGNDSRTWGWLPADSIKAKILFRVRRTQK